MTTRALQITELLTPVVDPTTGIIADGYTAYFYAAGTSDAKTNPYTSVVLGAGAWESATAQVYGDGNYKIIIKNGDGTTVLEWDDVKIQANNISVVTKTGNYTATPDDDVILVDSSGGNITISIETVANFEHPLTIKKIAAGNTVTIDPSGAQTIDGESTIALTRNYQTITIYPDTTATTWRRGYDMLSSLILDQLKTVFSRSRFTYNGGAVAYTVKAKAANYWCKDKYCFWNSELTTTAIGTPAADTFYYLYLDHSAITSGVAITNSELIWSDTAPSWSDTYRGLYNGDDRCIMGVISNGGPTNILNFYHDGGDFVGYDAPPLELDDVGGTDWTNEILTIPAFSTRALVRIWAHFLDNAGASFKIRVEGSSSAGNGVIVSSAGVGYTDDVTTVDVYTDASQIIEWVASAVVTDATFKLFTVGWYLPIGM